MRYLLASVICASLLTINAIAQATKPETPKAAPVITSLAVEVEGGKSLQLKASDLAKLPRKEVRAKDHDGKEATYSGVELRDILLSARAIFGKEFRGAQLANFILIEAADGYKAVFAAAELEAAFTDKLIILADTKDGKPLGDANGPWQMIVPDDKKHGRWVRQVTAIRLKSASPRSAHTTTVSTLDDADLVREVIFKHTIQAWLRTAGTIRSELKAVYLSVDDAQDPSPSLLGRFTGLGLPVKKDSECFIGDGGKVLDVVTKERGVRLDVSKLKWITKDEVVATAGSQIGNMGAGDCTYTVKRDNGIWKITARENCVIS